MFFSRVYGFDIGEVDVGVVECDEVNRVQMVGLLMLSDLLSNKGDDGVWFILPIYGVSCSRYVDLGFYAERRQVVGRAYQ